MVRSHHGRILQDCGNALVGVDPRRDCIRDWSGKTVLGDCIGRFGAAMACGQLGGGAGRGHQGLMGFGGEDEVGGRGSLGRRRTESWEPGPSSQGGWGWEGHSVFLGSSAPCAAPGQRARRQSTSMVVALPVPRALRVSSWLCFCRRHGL